MALRFPPMPRTARTRPSLKAAAAFSSQITSEHIALAGILQLCRELLNRSSKLVRTEERLEKAFTKRIRKIEDNLYIPAARIIGTGVRDRSEFQSVRKWAVESALDLAKTKYHLKALPNRIAEKIDEALNKAKRERRLK